MNKKINECLQLYQKLLGENVTTVSKKAEVFTNLTPLK